MANTSNSWTPAALMLLATRSTTPAAWLTNTGMTEGGKVEVVRITPSVQTRTVPAYAPISKLMPQTKTSLVVGRTPSAAPLPVITKTVMPVAATKLSSNPTKPLTVLTIAMPTSDSPVPGRPRAPVLSSTSGGASPSLGAAQTATPKVIDSVSVPGWVPTVLAALQTVARELANPQFTEWVGDSRPIIALAMSESGGKYSAAADEGYSTKLGRQYVSFGLFQINELWAQTYFQNAATLIGPVSAKQIPPFPTGASWTRAESQAALTAWPGQIWYAMCVLRGFSKTKNTFFSSMKPGAVVAAKPPPNRNVPGEYATAAKVAPKLQALSASLGIPPAALALKAYWLASSLGGMNKVLESSDSRLLAYAKAYKGIAT